ncbi:hypothetical protein Z043_120614 [Scleropages formosus]|uniref:Uncharacterized protein n=1 Tax=Scleropages formosus TaxID=113540 RepID=A0A0N8JWL9_SCLFO|nr:hypothetical protein Z043_120614 [Scleropages formosus]
MPPCPKSKVLVNALSLGGSSLNSRNYGPKTIFLTCKGTGDKLMMARCGGPSFSFLSTGLLLTTALLPVLWVAYHRGTPTVPDARQPISLVRLFKEPSLVPAALVAAECFTIFPAQMWSRPLKNQPFFSSSFSFISPLFPALLVAGPMGQRPKGDGK